MPGGGSEEDPDRSLAIGPADAQVLGRPLHDLLNRTITRVFVDDAEHPGRRVVVRGELGLPVGEVAPLRVVVERARRSVEGVRVVEATAAHTRPGEDHDVGQFVDALDAIAAEPWRPQVVLDVPRGLGEVRVGEASPGLEDEDRPALLGQAERGHRAAETGADDQDIDIDRGAVGGVLR